MGRFLNRRLSSFKIICIGFMLVILTGAILLKLPFAAQHPEDITFSDKESGKSCPTEILEAIASINAEGRPIWKPMHMQPIYRMNGFVTRDGNGRARTNAYIAGEAADVGMDIFSRGLCLPSDNKMTPAQQDRIIEVIRACFE